MVCFRRHVCLLLLLLKASHTAAVECVFPAEDHLYTTISETAPPDTVVWSFIPDPQDVWTIADHIYLSYVNFTQNSSHVTMTLAKELDLEIMNPRPNPFIDFELYCTNVRLIGAPRKWGPQLRVKAVNEYSPQFAREPFVVNVTEGMAAGSSVFDLSTKVSDADYRSAGVIEILLDIVPYSDSDLDGSAFFTMNYNTRQVVARKDRSLDYDLLVLQNRTTLYLNVSAQDQALDPLITYTTLTVNLMDADDLDPSFVTPCDTETGGYCTVSHYSTTITRQSYKPILTIKPSGVMAIDRDTLNYPIEYSFKSGSFSNYSFYFSIDNTTGDIRQAHSFGDATDANFIDIFLQAEEMGPSVTKRTAVALLRITIRDIVPTDTSPVPVTFPPHMVKLWVFLVVLFLVCAICACAMIAMYIMQKKRSKHLLISPLTSCGLIGSCGVCSQSGVSATGSVTQGDPDKDNVSSVQENGHINNGIAVSSSDIIAANGEASDTTTYHIEDIPDAISEDVDGISKRDTISDYGNDDVTYYVTDDVENTDNAVTQPEQLHHILPSPLPPRHLPSSPKPSFNQRALPPLPKPMVINDIDRISPVEAAQDTNEIYDGTKTPDDSDDSFYTSQQKPKISRSPSPVLNIESGERIMVMDDIDEIVYM